MPERVYMNRTPGEERIHIEISRDDLREMLARPAGPAARRFWGLLASADHEFEFRPTPSTPQATVTQYASGSRFEWTDAGGGWIAATPGSAAVRVTTGVDGCDIERDHVEEVVAGIRGIASETDVDEMAASLRRDGFGDDEIAAMRPEGAGA